MGAGSDAFTEGVFMAPLDSRYTQVGFYFISVQVCLFLESFQRQNKRSLRSLSIVMRQKSTNSHEERVRNIELGLSKARLVTFEFGVLFFTFSKLTLRKCLTRVSGESKLALVRDFELDHFWS